MLQILEGNSSSSVFYGVFDIHFYLQFLIISKRTGFTKYLLKIILFFLLQVSPLNDPNFLSRDSYILGKFLP